MAASLLRHRGGSYEPYALHHWWEGDRESAARFEAASGARVFRFDAGWRPNPRDDRTLFAKVGSWAKFHAALPRLVAEARRFRPDAIYSSQQTWDCYAASWMARLLRVSQIIHLHYTVGPWLGRWTLRQLRRSARVVAVSDFIRRDAIAHGVAAERVQVVLNPIAVSPPPPAQEVEEVRRSLGIERGQPVAGIVSRIDEGKGHDDVLAAFAQVLQQIPRARLLVVGDGYLRARVETAIAARGLGASVQMLGFRRDVPAILGLIDVFLHPSRSDPCPLGVLEASAAGKPVLAYAEGGIPELVADGQTGVLVPTGETAALAAALLRLLRDPLAAQALGAAGRERMARTFRPEEAGARFAEVVTGLKRS